MDELIEAPSDLAGQGGPEAIIEARGKTIRDLKVVKLSTPAPVRACRISRTHKTGDQREYMIPCPRRAGFQFLEFMKDGKTWGLYDDYDFDKSGKGSLIQNPTRYKCKREKRSYVSRFLPSCHFSFLTLTTI
jgi:phage terminase large subunit GpA-like protein